MEKITLSSDWWVFRFIRFARRGDLLRSYMLDNYLDTCNIKKMLLGSVLKVLFLLSLAFAGSFFLAVSLIYPVALYFSGFSFYEVYQIIVYNDPIGWISQVAAIGWLLFTGAALVGLAMVITYIIGESLSFLDSIRPANSQTEVIKAWKEKYCRQIEVKD